MYDWLFLEVVRAGRYIFTAGDPEVERAGRYIYLGLDMMPQHVERTNIQNKAKFVFHNYAGSTRYINNEYNFKIIH